MSQYSYIQEVIFTGVSYNSSEISRDFVDKCLDEQSSNEGEVELVPIKTELCEAEDFPEDFPDYVYGITEKVIRYCDDPCYEEISNPTIISYIRELPEFELNIEHQNKVRNAIQINNLPNKLIKTYIVKYIF